MPTIRLLIVCLSALSLAHGAQMRSMDDYRSIVDRNPFGLRPVPPPPVNTAPTNAAPPPKAEQFYLTGISSIGYPNRPKKAFLLNKDNSKKDYNDKYYTLQINDKQGDLRLDDIDETGRRVKVTYQGSEMWLSMKDNGVPTPTSTAPAAVPGMPGVPGMQGAPGALPVPGQMNSALHPAVNPLPGSGIPPAPTTTFTPNTSNRRLPRSQMNMNAGGAYTPNIPNQNQFIAPDQGNQSIPQQNTQPIDPVLQYVNMATQQKIAEQQGQVSPPVPPMVTSP